MPILEAKKEKIVLSVLEGKFSVSEASKKNSIARKTIYAWIGRYKKGSLASQYKKGKKHPLAVYPKAYSYINKWVTGHPGWGCRRLSAELKTKNICLSYVQVNKLLNQIGAESYERRVNYARNFAGPGRNREDVRLEIVNKAIVSMVSVSSLSDSYKVARKTIYKWIKKYQANGNIKDSYAAGSMHPRAIYPKITEKVLAMVVANPEYSVHKLSKFFPASSWTIWSILDKNNLNTYNLRLEYSKITSTAAEEKVSATGIFGRVRSVFESFTPNLAPAPPPGTTVIVKTFLISLFSTLFLALPSIWWISIISSASGFAASVGMIFALSALSFGMFFFFYSLKYFISTAIVLSYSQKEGLEGSSVPAAGLKSDLGNIRLKRHPFVSVHLALYNEKNVVERLAKAVTSFDYDNYEVIFADDSTDETSDKIGEFQKNFLFKGESLRQTKGDGWTLTEVEIRHGVTFKHLHRTTRSGYKGAALGLALKLTNPKAEFISVFDADFVPYSDSLMLFLKYFKLQNNGSEDYLKSTTASVQGYQWHVLNKSENWITRGVRSEYAGSYVIERAGTEIYGGLKQISGSVYMIRKDVLEEIGWGTSITEDFELTLKLYEKGYKVVYTPYIQAPAECVSTLRRLVRQRMRWAEGHSFNIKKMFLKLLLSPKLTSAEKFETVYLTPYYLQALFFLVGTMSWLISETVFKVRLPFWTELWGWSLVLTNMISLPLLNSVGLFLEESDKKDYLGITSFVALSYIVVPFQAYAAVKGFLEKEEGPWFRTPKTGRITDTFKRSEFYRFISGILPGKNLEPINDISPDSGAGQYLSLATANNRFDGFNLRKSKNRVWLGKTFLSILLLISTTLVSYAPYIESINDFDVNVPSVGKIIGFNGLVSEVHAADLPGEEQITNGSNIGLVGSKSTYSFSEHPTLTVTDRRSIFEKLIDKLRNDDFSSNISVKVINPEGSDDESGPVVSYQGGVIEIGQNKYSGIVPGKYQVEVGYKDESIIQDFSWGVLALNTNKSIYLPNDTAYIQMSAINDVGHTICDADLSLEILDAANKKVTLSTKDGTIARSGECGMDNVTDTPDYSSRIQVTGLGKYSLKLTNISSGSNVTNSFEVKNSVPFDIERVSATRINPFEADYVMKFIVKSNQDFKGEVTEKLPESFSLNSNASWTVDWKSGETHYFSYEYSAPEFSPEFYLLGPLTIGSYQEGGSWQVVADSPGTVCSNSTSFRSVATGNWGTVGTWECFSTKSTWITPTRTPTSADLDITIQAGTTVTVAANVSVDQVTVASTGQITVSSNITLTVANGTGTDLTVNGTLSNAGTITTTGTVAFGAGSTYTHNRNGGTIPTATWNGTSTANITGVTSTVPSGLSQTFGHFTWNSTSQSGSINLGGAPTTIAGNLTITSTNSQILYYSSTQSPTLALTGDLTVSAGTFNLNQTSGTVTANIAGNVVISSGSMLVSGAGTVSINMTAGNWTNNGGTFTPGTGTVTFSGSAAQAINGSATSQTFYGLTLTKTAGQTLSVSGSTTTLSVTTFTETTGNFTAPATMNIAGAATLTAGTYTAGANTNMAGENWTKESGSTFTANSGTVSFTGASGTTQIITGAITFYNLSANADATRTLQFTASATYTVTNNLTLTGTSCSAILKLRSSGAAQWTLDDDAGGTTSVDYVDVEYSNASDQAITSAHGITSGNNSNWTITSVCPASSTSDTATGNSFQRKTFYDSVNSRYWVFFHNGDSIESRYSVDNSSWSLDDDHLAYDTSDFSVWWQSVGGTAYVWLAVSGSNDIKVRQGTLSTSGVTWDTDVATALNEGDGRCTSYSYPYVTLDSPSSGNPHVWVTGRCYDGTNYVIEAVETSTTAEADPSTWTYSTVSQISNDQAVANDHVYANIVPLSSGDMYATFANGTALEGCKWINSETAWKNSAGTDSCVPVVTAGGETVEVGGTAVNIDDASDFGNPDGINGAGRQVVRTKSGILYSFFNDGGSCEIWKSTDGSSWAQQQAGTSITCRSGYSVGAAVDNNQDIHIAYINGASLKYRNYDTATDNWDAGGEKNVYTQAGTTARIIDVAIAVDSSNIPHVAFRSGDDDSFTYYVKYSNYVGGSWDATPVNILTGTGLFQDIAIDEDNRPIISYVELSSRDLYVGTGNQNDASSFTLYDVDMNVEYTIGLGSTSIAVNPSTGDTWVAYRNGTDNYVSLVKRNDGDETTAWATASYWTSDITHGLVGYEPSIAVAGSGDIYVLYQDASADQKIVYDVYNSVGQEWAGETALETPGSGVDFKHVKVKWSFEWNNYGANKIDYIYSNGTDVFWNYLYLRRSPTNINDASNFGALEQGGRQVVRTSGGDLYSFIEGKMWKSTDSGATWTQKDVAKSPTANTIAIGSDDTIHVVCANTSALYYDTFSPSTDTFAGSNETVHAIMSGEAFGSEVAMVLDSNNIPHVVYIYNDEMGVETTLSYDNRIGGVWNSTDTGLETNVTGMDIDIFSPGIAVNESNYPEVVYNDGPSTTVRAQAGNSNDPSAWASRDVDTTGSEPSIGVDSVTGYTWIAYKDLGGTISLAKYSGTDYSGWTTAGNWAVNTSKTDTGVKPSLAIDTSSNVYALYTDDQDDIVIDKYNGTSWIGETLLEEHGALQTVKARWSYQNNPSYSTYGIDYIYSDGTDVFYNRYLLESGGASTPGTQDAIDTMTGNINDNFSIVSNGTDTVHLIFVDDESTDQVSYKRWTNSGGWTTPTLANSLVTGGADNADAYVSLSLDTGSGVLYALWIDTAGSDIYYSFCTVSTGCDVATEWAAESGQETLWKSTGTNTNVSSNYSGNGRIFAEWTEGSGSPYSINFDIIIAIPEHLLIFFMAGPLLPFLLKRKRKCQSAIVRRI